MNTKEKILDSLKHGPLTDSEIAALIGAPVPSVRRCRGELLVAKKIEAYITDAVDGSMSWRLPQVESAKRPKPVASAFDLKSRPPESRPAPGNIVQF